MPGGNYLCTDCAEEDREDKIKELLYIAHNEHNASPEFIVQQIVISGILQWDYQLQVYLGNQSI